MGVVPVSEDGVTLELDWPGEVVDRLTEEARAKGLTLGDYLLRPFPGIVNVKTGDDDETHCRRAAAIGRMTEISEKVRPDPEGWTSRGYINFGRR